MMLARVALRSLNDGLSMKIQRLQIARTLSTNVMPEFDNGSSENQNTNSFESADDFERRIFNANPSSDAFFQRLDKLEKARDRSGPTFKFGDWNKSDSLDGLDDSFDTLSDGMDGKLKKAATYFEFNPDEFLEDDYSFRPDMSFKSPMTYETKDLDLRKPGIRKPFKRREFEVTTKEVLMKADFRNVRFLANFITDAGIIIKRSQTKISAKAQRKVAREIKTARAFGLMPFTTMGTKSFNFGKTMQGLDEDFEYENFDRSNANAERSQGPMREQVAYWEHQ